jgi:serine/threonine protein kinase
MHRTRHQKSSESASYRRERAEKTTSSSSSQSTQKRKQQEKWKQKRREERERKLLRSTTSEFIPGYEQGRILGQGSFGSVWTLVEDSSLSFLPLHVTKTTTTTTTTTTSQKVAFQPESQLSSFGVTVPTNASTDLGGTFNKPKDISKNWILKVSPLIRDRDGRLKDTFNREIFYLRYLAAITPKIVPQLLQAKIVDKNGLQLMERFEGPVKALGLEQAKNLNISGRSSQAYTWKQLMRIIELAKHLDALGIIHGDLKHSNMLYRWLDDNHKDNPNAVEICLCDFGFTGKVTGDPYYPLIGFMRHFGCNPKRTIHYGSSKSPNSGGIFQPRFKLASPIPTALIPVINRCQLYISLAELTRLYVWNEKKSTRISPIELRKLMGLDHPDILEAFRHYCPKMKTLPPISVPSSYSLSRMFFSPFHGHLAHFPQTQTQTQMREPPAQQRKTTGKKHK